MDGKTMGQVHYGKKVRQKTVIDGVVSEHRIYFGIKRAFDIAASIAALILLSPVYLLLGLCIRLEDGGGVIYEQERLGQYGVPIHIYKFRTMCPNADDLAHSLTPEMRAQYEREFKLDNDPRITKVGAFLRKTSLDELPQFMNILKGELSLVGPRPVLPKEAELYGTDRARFLSVRPGLTGYWQAYMRNNASYETGERQRMEMYYVENQSVWLDVKIMIKTVEAVVRKTGI